MGNAIARWISLDIFMNGATFCSTLFAAHYRFYSGKVFTVEYHHTLLCEELVEGRQSEETQRAAHLEPTLWTALNGCDQVTCPCLLSVLSQLSLWKHNIHNAHTCGIKESGARSLGQLNKINESRSKLKGKMSVARVPNLI